jgi:hypothetical protein
MQIPVSASLLSLWEQGRDATPTGKALLLLAALFPTIAVEQLVQWPLGMRDAYLLQLRRALFGAHMEGSASCPACGALLEFTLSTDMLLSAAGSNSSATLPVPTVGSELEPAALANPPRSLAVGGYELTFRLPSSQDMLALERSKEDQVSDAQAVESLLARCLLTAQRDAQPVGVAELPPEVREALSAAMARADTLAEIQLEFSCAACGHASAMLLDVASYVWQEIGSWATTLLQEIHALALAYGWREADILALSAWRRRYYLSLIYG